MGLKRCHWSSRSYPNKSIRVLTVFAAGGAASVIARLIGQKLTESWA